MRTIRVTELHTGRVVLDVEATPENAYEHARNVALAVGPGVDLKAEFLVDGVLVDTILFVGPAEFTHPDLIERRI